MDFDHKVFIETEDERDYWECSCGRSGSTTEGRGYLASDQHIKFGETRADTNRRP